MKSPTEPSNQPSPEPARLPDQISLRPATWEDVPAITMIQNQGIEDRTATAETEPHTLEDQGEWFRGHGSSEPIIVAECAGQVIGWASLSQFSHRKAYAGVKELSIYVERSYRGKGVGTMLLEQLLQRARQLNIYKIVLNTLPINYRGIALYRKFGFRTVGTWRSQAKIDSQWIDVMLMEKHLSLPAQAASGKNYPASKKRTQVTEPSSSGPIVVKIGGSTLGSHDTTLRDLVTLQQQGKVVVVVHGGGKVITAWMTKQGVMPRFVRGLRVTDAASLEIVIAVLTGLINKSLVASLHAMGARAVGISGVDGGLLQARIMNPELGLVGRIAKVNVNPLYQILNAGSIPIVAPVALRLAGDATADGGILNVNADDAAGEIAVALSAGQLIFLTDVPGIMDSSKRVIPRLVKNQAQGLIESGIVSGGMTPKLEACLRALEKVQSAQIIDGRRPGALLNSLEGKATGTKIG